VSGDRIEVRIGVRPSNGTEGGLMQAELCDRCTADHEWHRMNAGLQEQPDESCPILMSGLLGEGYPEGMTGPPEWSRAGIGHWHCTGFTPCNCGDNGPDRDEVMPRPECPGQGSLLDILAEVST